MIPILYDSTETEFTSQGLGCLTDAISCEVTEERNGEFELELEYPISGIHYGDIAYSRYIAAVPADGEDAQPFEIYKITRPLDGVVTVYARHLSYRLGYTPVRPTTAATSAASALSTLKSAAVVPCPFTFSSDVTKAGTFTNSKLQSLRSLLGGQTGSILDVFGGEYKFDKWNVSLLSSRGSSIPVTIEYGKNLTDLKQEENIESTYTAVICTWKKEVDGVTTTQTGDIVYTENKNAFPYVRTLVVDKSMDYDTQPTVSQLTADATSYIKANNVGVPNVSIDISFVNLRDTDEYKNVAPLQRIHLCDTIKVKFSKLGVNASAKITKTVYDSLSERYKLLTIGDARSSLARTVVGISEEINSKADEISSALQSDIDRATQLITGNKGGYVVIQNNETTGYPEEILVMDQPDKDTAQNVWRFNKSGLGHANSYNGDVDLALTMDGKIVADMIKAGTLNADLIKTGTISNPDGTISINLDKADITFANSDGDTCEIIGPTLLLRGSDGRFTYITLDSIGFYTSAGLAQGYYGRTCMRFNKTGHGLNSGRGVYADSTGLSVGQTGSEWNNQPVLRVYQYGDEDYVEVTSLRFMRSNGNSAGVIGWWNNGSSKGLAFSNGTHVHIEAADLKVDQTITCYYLNETSDRRLKQDIEDLDADKATDFIMSLRPVRYEMTATPDRVDHGFIAQDVQDAIYDDWSPVKEIPHQTDTDYLALSYTGLIADLVATVQKQNKRINNLEERLTRLEERYADDKP